MRLYMCGRWCCRGDCAHLRPARALGIGAALHDTDMFLHLGGRRERVRDEMSLGDRRPARNIGDRLERLHIKMASRAQLFILVDLPASSLAAPRSGRWTVFLLSSPVGWRISPKLPKFPKMTRFQTICSYIRVRKFGTSLKGTCVYQSPKPQNLTGKFDR